MIHAAIFDTCDPAARTMRLVTASRENVQRNTPPGGCWRPVPAGCATVAEVPALGALGAAPV